MYEETKEIDEQIFEDDLEILAKYRKRFRAAVEAWEKWRNEAREDYEFLAGKQWSADELAEFDKQKRPALVINRIKPLINILSGWQRLNRYDIDFLPRTADDAALCEVRAGMTKYVMDRSDYDGKESRIFLDCATGGIGWFGTSYSFDYEVNDGEVKIERIDPFSMYVDPEAHEPDFSDAKFICRAKWVDKDELKLVYPEKADAIESNYNVYDPIENESHERVDIDPLWYNSELKKVRVVEFWYKERTTRTLIYLADGRTIPFTEETKEEISQLMTAGLVADYDDVPITEVRLCTFFDRTLLEDIPSPYKHGEFPYIPLLYHYYGVGDTPAGFVRALKDPQREINKRRIQELHILNTSSNGGGYIEEGAMTPEQFAEFEEKNNIPGHFNRVISIDKIREREPKAPPTAVINAETQATNDLMAISGINENLLGTDIPSGASGRAIELKQKQAVTHLATMFDNLRSAKKKLAYLLWGRRGHPGIIPQFYTADKVYRIDGENGQEFIHVNQQVQDPLTGAVVKTLNDLSVGEFDIVVADVEASTTQRRAQLWTLVDAGSKLGIPGQLLVDAVLDLADIPKRDKIVAKYQQMQQEQAQAQQAERDLKLKIEEIKNQDSRQIITFKDAPLPIQMAMAAKAGIVPQEFANELMRVMIEQMTPQLAKQMQMQAAQQAQMQAQQQQMQAAQQMIQQQQMPQQSQMPVPLSEQQIQNQQQPATMTKAAAESVMLGMSPAAI